MVEEKKTGNFLGPPIVPLQKRTTKARRAKQEEEYDEENDDEESEDFADYFSIQPHEMVSIVLEPTRSNIRRFLALDEKYEWRFRHPLIKK